MRLEVSSEAGVVGLDGWRITQWAHERMLEGDIRFGLSALLGAIRFAVFERKEQSHQTATLFVTHKERGILAPLLKVLGLRFADTGIWANKDDYFSDENSNWWFFLKEPATERARWRIIKEILGAINIKRERVRIRSSDLLLGEWGQWLAGESFDPNEQTQILTAVSRTTAGVKLIISPSDGEYRLSLQLLTMGLCALYLAHRRRRKVILREIRRQIKNELPLWVGYCIRAALREQYKRGQAEVNQGWWEAVQNTILPILQQAVINVARCRQAADSLYGREARQELELLIAALSSGDLTLEELTRLAKPAESPASSDEMPAADQETEPDEAGPEMEDPESSSG